MSYSLSEAEVRVLGALIEKEITTPDYYPLSLNALVAACNQTSNRDPVLHLEASQVAEAADTLRRKQIVHAVNSDGARVIKYRHVAYETLNLTRPAIAVMCVLMLRGRQTVGEIRTRSGRLYDFTSLDDVETTLNQLASRDTPLAVCLQRQPGRKEVRYAHLLSGEVKSEEVAAEPGSSEPSSKDRIARLELEVENLKREFERFRQQFE